MLGISAGKSTNARTAIRGKQSPEMMTTESHPEFEFTLVLGGITGVTAKVENALFEAGCDDATISLRQGRVYLSFSRTAATLKDAIISAIQDIHHAAIGAEVLRVDQSDLVTQAEIARRIDRSRQLFSQYISGGRGPGGFPAPACNITDTAPLWYWCEVAQWLWANDMISESDLRNAQDITTINSVLEIERQRRVFPESTRSIMEAIGTV